MLKFYPSSCINNYAFVFLFGVIMFGPCHADVDFEHVETMYLYNVFDIGVAPIGKDGKNIRFTTNHSALQYLDSPSETGSVVSGVDAFGLHQDTELRGLEPGNFEFVSQKPFHIRIERNTYLIESGSLAEGRELEGSVVFPWPVKAKSDGDATVDVHRCHTMPNCYQVDYIVRFGGSVSIQTKPLRSDGFPIYFEFKEGFDSELVQIGRLNTKIKDNGFTYQSKDRHGLALRHNRKGNVELFISRGGARGLLNEVHPDAQDELFEFNGSTFNPVFDLKGISKNACPGRQIAWMDVNSDGLQDLYQVCGRERGDNSSTQNRLYLQAQDGTFTEQAAKYGLNLPGAGVFKFIWVTHDNKEQLSLVWVTDNTIELLSKKGQRFIKNWGIEREGSTIDRLIVGDLNFNGSWEVLVLSRSGAVLVELLGLEYRLLDLGELGLPTNSTDGSFVDYDSDGAQDLFLIPHGVFSYKNGRYHQIQSLDLSWVRGWGETRNAWFDYDNDGDLDLWIVNSEAVSAKLVPNSWREHINTSYLFQKQLAIKLLSKIGFGGYDRHLWESRLYENKSGGDCHAIKIAPNRMNNDYLAAKVVVKDGAKAYYRFVGDSDYSRFSQTANAIYFCGKEPATVEVLAPSSVGEVYFSP